MAQVGYGPPWVVDGPPPIPQLYGLLAAAEAPASGVRIVTDLDANGNERWINGVEVYPFPPGVPEVFDACAPSSAPQSKGFGSDDLQRPMYGAYTVLFAETCTAYRVPNQEEFVARALTAFTAVESAGLAKEFLSGDKLPSNPHLADGSGAFPLADVDTSVRRGIALLDAEIAASGRLGLVHVSPQVFVRAKSDGAAELDLKSGVWRTPNGNVVIADFGYVDGATPLGHAAPAGTQEWIFATGPVDVRRSAVFVVPESVSEALDRGLGATNDRPNAITYRVERYYLASHDTEVQASVLVDPCKEAC